MALETYAGPSVPLLLERARQEIGPDAVILQVRRRRDGGGYEVIACDPESATRLAPAAPRPAPETPVAARLVNRTEADRYEAAPARPAGPRLVAVVGPTGAGKTTTLAKLATHPGAFGARKVGLLGLDSYRVGAVEQLRTYAEIARLPMAVAYDDGDLAGALRWLAECDLILVDTPGRGPRQEPDTRAVRRWLGKLAPAEVHLVVPAGLQRPLVDHIIASFRPFGLTHLLPTKLDEWPDDDTAFAAAQAAGLPVQWFTHGQNVPADLSPAAGRHRAADRPAPRVQGVA